MTNRTNRLVSSHGMGWSWILLLLAAVGLAWTAQAVTYTPASEGWGGALTIPEGETVVIDGGEFGTWAGAVTVGTNAILKTRGVLAITGTTTVLSNGTMDVETGVTTPAFAAQTMRGTLIVREGAEVRMTRTDALGYSNSSYELHVYGTLDCRNFRQTAYAVNKIHLYEGAVVKGNGDAYGGIDYCQDGGHVVVHGSATVEVPLRVRSANQNLYFDCFAGVKLRLLGGFSSSAGNVVQVAATAEEGNASGTCANAEVEVGPCKAMSGTFTFVSKASVALKGGAQSLFSIETSAAELELRADKDVAFANHVSVQAIPAVTATAALSAVRLTGDGMVAFQDAAPTIPVAFEGPSLAIDAGTPVALAAGSSAVSNMTIGVEGLAAGTAATLLTGVDASFDVSKVSAQAMHNGVLLGTPAAVTLDNGNVVTAGVAAYDAAAWIEPYIKTTALIWLDASDAANFVFKDKTFGYVTGWKDLSSNGRDATSYMENYGMLGVTNGVPAYMMGNYGSKIDMNYTSMTTIRSVFWVMAIQQNMRAFFLANSAKANNVDAPFHRGSNGEYAGTKWCAPGWKDGSVFCDGTLVTVASDKPPTDRHVYSAVLSANCWSDRLSYDRSLSDRNGGRDLSELIVLPDALSDADRQAIEAYLAAKWMGATPTEAWTDGTYVFKSELLVDGHIGGDKNLTFTDDASISIPNPDSDVAMVSTTGSVTIPAGSTLAVDVDAKALPLGTYTVIEAAGGITSLAQFAATAEAAPGAEATFSVAGGKLLLTVSAAATATTSLTWRPQDASDLAWDSANWLYSDGTTTGPFISYLRTVFDGGETVTGDVVVNDTYSVGPMSISGSRNYTFAGTGTLAGTEPTVIDVAGVVTMDGANLGDQDVIVSNGTLRVGVNAGDYALGTHAGKIKVVGGTLDVNTTDNTAARGLITHRKKVELSHGGSIVNNNAMNCFAIGNLSVLDTGTLGGSSRFDVRANAADADCTTTTVDGDANAVLTVDTTCTDAISFFNAIVNIGRIDVLNGMLRIEQTKGEHNVPNGIHVADGARLGCYIATVTTGATVYVDSGTAQIRAESGTSTMKSPLVVASGATAQLMGGATLNYEGGVRNAGTVRATAGTHVLKGEIAGSSYEVAGGQIRLAGAVQESSLAVPVTSSSLYVKDGMTAGTVTANVTDGDAGILLESAVAPVFDAYNLNLGAHNSHILPRVAGQIVDVGGTVNIDQSDSKMTYVYSTTNNNEFGIALKMVGTAGRLEVGINANRAGTLRLKEGTDLSVKYLMTGDNGSPASRGRVIIDPGAKVTVRSGGDVRNGHYALAPTNVQTHVMEIAGELDCSAGIVHNPMDAPRAEMYLREGGVLKAKGFSSARRGCGTNYSFQAEYVFPYGSGVGAGEGRNWFIMEGGRLELGSGGIYGTRTPGNTKFDFRNGDIVNKAAWGGNSVESTRRWGDYGFPMFFGYDAVGGEVTFDLGAFNVDWNTGLAGASDVTLKGSANFQGYRNVDRMQGAMIGKLTVQNTGANDLRVTSAFAGGLALAPGVNAQVAKYGETNYPYAVTVGKYQISQLDMMKDTAWSYNFVSPDFFNFAYLKFTTSPIASTTLSLGRGEFYVPADKAGPWTFAGNYDDRISLDVDGTNLFKTAVWNSVGRGTIELAEGWHKFTLSVYDGGKPGGPSGTDGWGDGKGLGFYVGETTDTAAGSYVKFEHGADLGGDATLLVRPWVNAAVWSWQATNVNWATTENWSHIKCIDTLAGLFKGSAADDTSDAAYFKSKASKFEGWFKVEEDKAGEWTFHMAYDDYKLLKVDGAEVCRSAAYAEIATGTTTLSAGWHRWEVRVGDGSGGWGAMKSCNGGNTLSFIAPGDAEKRFDENNLKLAATLGDVAALEPSGIYKDLELGAGATLTSSGTFPMPIFGTLKGTGALAGDFVFAGEHNAWEVACAGNARDLACASFANATPATFQGLKNVKATFDAKPSRRDYFLTGVVSGLAAADVAGATVTVTDGTNDYSANFTLAVEDGRLALVNSCPTGTMILLK